MTKTVKTLAQILLVFAGGIWYDGGFGQKKLGLAIASWMLAILWTVFK